MTDFIPLVTGSARFASCPDFQNHFPLIFVKMDSLKGIDLNA